LQRSGKERLLRLFRRDVAAGYQSGARALQAAERQKIQPYEQKEAQNSKLDERLKVAVVCNVELAAQAHVDHHVALRTVAERTLGGRRESPAPDLAAPVPVVRIQIVVIPDIQQGREPLLSARGQMRPCGQSHADDD